MENIVKWKGMELVISDFNKSHANGGRLGKFWVEDKLSGRVFLIKSSGWFSYEPFSEKIAYIIGKNLGIDVLEYDIIPAELFKGMLPRTSFCKYVSICEKIDRKGYSITSVAEIKRARNLFQTGKTDHKQRNQDIMYEILPKKYIDTMLLFDAIIGNEDRHYGNVHILRNLDGEMIGAPILDNGASLLAKANLLGILISGLNVGKWFDKTMMMYYKHKEATEHIETVNGINFNITAKTINILNEIEPTLQLMPKIRANAIKKYIVYRLHKHLGNIK